MRTTPLALALTLVAGSASLAAATPTVTETVIHDTTTPVEIKLDASTVLCSSADYGALFLKVGMPELARLTLLDHQNIGAGAPCVAAGVCKDGNEPEDIIDPAHPTEIVDINVKAIRRDEADATAQTCTTTLVERVAVTIRGFEFKHERTSPLGSRAYADCAQPSDETKVDAPDAETTQTEPGGCSVGRSGSASFALVIGALVLGARRRRRN